jgi:multidrug efflux system outer membrane protein
MRAVAASTLAAALLLSACSMTPHYVRPAAPVPDQWPQGAAMPAGEAAPGLAWRSMILDPRLQKVIAQMLANNRDLRAAVANVASARAISRHARQPVPTWPPPARAAWWGATAARPAPTVTARRSASSFEIDLFGRLRDQARAGFETYLATATARVPPACRWCRKRAGLGNAGIRPRSAGHRARYRRQRAPRTVELNQSLLASGLGNAADLESARTVLAQAEPIWRRPPRRSIRIATR